MAGFVKALIAALLICLLAGVARASAGDGVVVVTLGGDAEDIFPKFNLLADGRIVGSGEVRHSLQRFPFSMPDIDNVSRLEIEYLKDDRTAGEKPGERNLYVMDFTIFEVRTIPTGSFLVRIQFGPEFLKPVVESPDGATVSAQWVALFRPGKLRLKRPVGGWAMNLDAVQTELADSAPEPELMNEAVTKQSAASQPPAVIPIPQPLPERTGSIGPVEKPREAEPNQSIVSHADTLSAEDAIPGAPSESDTLNVDDANQSAPSEADTLSTDDANQSASLDPGAVNGEGAGQSAPATAPILIPIPRPSPERTGSLTRAPFIIPIPRPSPERTGSIGPAEKPRGASGVHATSRQTDQQVIVRCRRISDRGDRVCTSASGSAAVHGKARGAGGFRGPSGTIDVELIARCRRISDRGDRVCTSAAD